MCSSDLGKVVVVIYKQVINAICTRNLLHHAGGKVFRQIHQISNQFREFFHYSFTCVSYGKKKVRCILLDIFGPGLCLGEGGESCSIQILLDVVSNCLNVPGKVGSDVLPNFTLHARFEKEQFLGGCLGGGGLFVKKSHNIINPSASPKVAISTGSKSSTSVSGSSVSHESQRIAQESCLRYSPAKWR